VCSRNDSISNIAIVFAALGVWGTGSGIPDLIVAGLIGGLALYGSVEVLRRVKHEYATTVPQSVQSTGN
jgi:Co/Zn/Cd efflux system component